MGAPRKPRESAATVPGVSPGQEALPEHLASGVAPRREGVLRRLVEASSLLAEAPPDPASLLPAIARIAAEATGDACTIRLLAEKGSTLELVATHHDDPDVVRAMWEHAPRVTPEHGLWAAVLGERRMRMWIVPADGAPPEATPDQVEFLRRAGVRAMIGLPLVARDALLGSLAITRFSAAPFDEDEIALVRSFAARAALAIDNAQLLGRERRAREAAERAADRLARLQSVTSRLANAVRPPEVADVVLHHGIAAMHADSGTLLFLLEDGETLETIGAVGYPEDIVGAWHRLPLSAPVPIAEAVRTGLPVFVPTARAWHERYAPLRSGPRMGHHAWACIPLVSRGRVLGVIGLAFSQEQGFAEDDRRFMAALADLTTQAFERARVQTIEAHARAEAESLNRAKDDFLAVLSHELRTPLASVLGWAQLLQAKRPDDGTYARAVETIVRNARAQLRLVEDILDISHIAAGKLQLRLRRADIGAIARNAIDLAAPAVQAKGLALEATFDPEAREVIVDADRIQQILSSLLANAIKFTPKGGRVRVRVATSDVGVEVRVSDTGKGIPAEFLPHVFERFQQAEMGTTRSYGGLGLGLAIARHLVEAHGGTITADSEGLGRGASFTVTLRAPADDGTLTEPDATRPSRLSGARILIVGDDAAAAELLEGYLQAEGASITIARSASEALERIERAPCDVVIADIDMPDVDGGRFLREARLRLAEHGRYLPAVALSGLAGRDDVRGAYRAGFQVHLAKPALPDQVVEAVCRLVDRSLILP